jgi:hypothetical protein
MRKRSINEGYKSQKLKNIIAKHGKPVDNSDYIFLYDTTDDEVIGVSKDYDEIRQIIKNIKPINSNIIELEDGTYLAIDKSVYELSDQIKNRHIGGRQDKFGGYREKYHKNYETRGKNNNYRYNNDTIRSEFENKKHMLRAKKAKQLLTEEDIKQIYEYVEDHLNFDSENIDFERTDAYQSFEIDDQLELSFGTCYIATKWEVSLGEPWGAYGEIFCNGTISLDSLSLYIDDYSLGLSKDEGDGDYITDIELGLDYKGIKTEYWDRKIEAGVYSYDEMYGVSNRDFV